LLEGLQKFQGMPTIFCKIIRNYCDVDDGVAGLLREFTVNEILREADWLRRIMMREHERDDLVEVPECMKNIADLDLLDYLWKYYGL